MVFAVAGFVLIAIAIVQAIKREVEMKFVAGLASIEQVAASGLRDALRAAAALEFNGSKLNLEHLAALVNSGALTSLPARFPRSPHPATVGP
ncbi:hypothetical protein SAMN05661093_05982 [Kibdelosporangium aridum]|uniref:Uncharacterized protein n=1 Tax=Kibdelosporangium aridum TaxID=2030 RepID=A0A1Y5XV87_KIBAR|nr:hypothetical protein SAMN05661093_05982 [Kibdelosporangium aridum]